jgi:hypothetical protein
MYYELLINIFFDFLLITFFKEFQIYSFLNWICMLQRNILNNLFPLIDCHLSARKELVFKAFMIKSYLYNKIFINKI